MIIYFSQCEYGVSYQCGGVLDKPFTYLCDILAERFETENIEFPYSEIEIQLTLLPTEVKSSQCLEQYEKLPSYYRGKNMVRVILPETRRERTLKELFELLNKTFMIVMSKKKKSDLLDEHKINSVLLALEQDLEASDLWALHRRYEAIQRKNTIEYNRQGRLDREQAHTEKKRLIYDIRLYCRLDHTDEELLCFSSYGKDLCDRILEKLREKKFRLPGYSHLYVIVSDSCENALYHADRLENWYVYGLAVLENGAAYFEMNESEKKRLVFELIWQGLTDIANIDRLDMKTLCDVLDEVGQTL